MNETVKFNSKLVIRVPLYLREAFKKAAYKNKKEPSWLVRDFMRKYIAESRKNEQG